ncbi:MAG: response regulator [Acidaminococcaceae bacterium]|jgi:CheY-like chemotaxis protein/nitrogen-specific signal transduction histidine kinase|nr:response regulator [Acidaminococcaceae bacterium]
MNKQNNTTLVLELEKQKKQLQEAVAQADKANQAKSVFLSRISHNMRTPLNAILGLTTLLKASVTDRTIENDLLEIEISGLYLMNLINDTLDMNKIESGKLELNPIVCDGRTVFKTIVKLITPHVQSKNIEFRMHSDELPFSTLFIDVGRIQQVIMNIVGNAVKFTPEYGTIDFSITNLSVKDGIITDKIVIKDSGIGISPEFLPHLFEPFAQEDATRNSSQQGTGLGMSICKYLIDLMGGSLSVKSEVGKGTAITIILPMRIATDKQIEDWKKTKAIPNDNSALNGRKVLLCEDHPLNANIAKRLLEYKGMVVEHAENGQIGVKMFEKSEIDYYDAILMDIRMPVMDGLEATKVIRSLPREDAARIPIIALSANAMDDDISSEKQVGINAHVSKPIQADLLYGTLSSYVREKTNIKRPRILIVDDMEVDRNVVKAVIKKEYDVLEAEDGYKALELLKQHRGIVAIVTDIKMPKMDGIELIQKIRSNHAWNHIAILVNTLFGDTEQEERLLELGTNDFIYKPTTPKILALRIKNALRKI